jgi:hypothetical protein
VDLTDRRVAYYTRVQICIMCSSTLAGHDAGGNPSYLVCMNRLSRLLKSRLYAVFTSVSTSAVEESIEQAIYNAGWLMKV